MKPAPFAYHAPASIAEATQLLTTLPDSRPLAGGQSLVPMLNLRAATPSHLIDLAGIAELRGIDHRGPHLRIGAMTTQRDVERSALVRRYCPLLAEAVDYIGHQQTRNRGTIGGSLCHLDPGAELPVAAAALEAVLIASGPDWSRRIPFDAFPAGYLSSTLETGEILTQIEFPECPPDEGFAFLEFNQRPADLAIVSVAVLLRFEMDNVVRARIAVGGIDFAPVRLANVETGLVGNPLNAAALAEAEKAAAARACEGDVVNPPEFRAHIAGVLVRRALVKAAARARDRR
jgi:carbon-monoxide dehydrogenase medium subunit